MRRATFCGFTLVELLIVVAIVAILIGILIPVIGKIQRDARIKSARMFMDTAIAPAIEEYRLRFKYYPPDDVPSTNGSEILAHHLCRGIRVGEMVYATLIPAKNLVELNGNSFPELLSPLGGTYVYFVLLDTNGNKIGYRVVDPGPDKLLGGTVDPVLGFVVNATDANGDGVPDHLDNIYNPPDK